MDPNSCFRSFCSLLLLVCVSGDITRKENFFKGEFSNNHKGRMLRVLMVFNKLPLDKCVVKCIQHIRCRTVNYNLEKEKCELTEVDYNDDEADQLSYGWYNYGTQSKVDGAWGPWRNVTRCSATCAGGTMNQARDCDSPEPQHGGNDCVGKGERTIDCNTHSCPVVNQWSAWTNDGQCSVTCGGGTLKQTRVCNSTKEVCDGLGERTISCNTESCPAQVPGNWGAWTITKVCNDECKGGTYTKERKCDSPAPAHGGADCIGNKVISLHCSKSACPVVNIARDKDASQNGNPGLASRGNDGIIATYTLTSYKESPNWQVDLAGDFQIEYIIFRRTVGNEDVKVTAKSATGSKFLTCKDPLEVNSGVARFSCETNHKFRWIKVIQKVQGQLMINEFEVYIKS